MLTHFILRFALWGGLIPVIFILIWWFLEIVPSLNRLLGEFIYYIQLCLYPSSIIMMAGAGGGKVAVSLGFMATGVNILLYGIAGFFVGLYYRGQH